MKKQTLFYCKYSGTIRQAPENYLIAKKDPNDQARWIMDADLASNKKLATKIFLALYTFEAHYGTGGGGSSVPPSGGMGAGGGMAPPDALGLEWDPELYGV